MSPITHLYFNPIAQLIMMIIIELIIPTTHHIYVSLIYQVIQAHIIEPSEQLLPLDSSLARDVATLCS